MTSRPGLAKVAPILGGLANTLDAVEAALVAYEEEIARLTAERDEARAKLDAAIRSHNLTLAELGTLRAQTGVVT